MSVRIVQGVYLTGAYVSDILLPMRNCRVCGNSIRKQLNRHHLLPREIRRKGTRQITVKLCRDGKGCAVHQRFHQGETLAAMIIREHLKKTEVSWMIGNVGTEWVEKTYPLRLGR